LFLRQGWLKEVEFDYLRKDGTIMPGLLNATAVYDEFGRYQWSRTTLYDISDRRTIEERLHTLHRELDIHAQQLKAANEELESFAYSISHDLRAPLRAIDGYARMLDDDYGPALDDEGRRRIGIIRSSGRRMSDLIDDLLAFSHVGRREKFLEDADMNAIVNDAWSEVCASSEGTPPALSVGALPRATVDRAMFKQVWVNLLSNAWKYSAKKDHPIIRISGHASATGLEYRIEDNGAGFDMRYYDKLFGVFQRLHTEREFPGTGVGLAIVQRVLKQHGGQARGESRLGEGATFYLTLPRKVHDR
jgi:light-regulated signal transduction histidine kinase (bacteriophytochrome)